MLESAIKNFSQYAPYLAENTKQSLASLVLEDMIPDEELVKNLVLRDTKKITNEEFLKIEMKRINGENIKDTQNVVAFPSKKHGNKPPLLPHTEVKKLYEK